MTTGFDRRKESGSDEPTAIRSLAVTVDDVLTALEAHQRADKPAVLRVTPPFAGRMRARLHVVGGEGGYDEGPKPLHLEPERFVNEGVQRVPGVDETEDELRQRDDYSVERHRDYHETAVEEWRASVRAGLVETMTFEVDDETHTVDVKYLGRQRE